MLPALAGLVVDGFELVEHGTRSLLCGSGGHEGSLHHVVDGHPLCVYSIRVALSLSL